MSSRASLNHVYRTVWNQALGAMVAVAEIETGRGGSSSGATPSRCGPRQDSRRFLNLSALAIGVALAWGVLTGSAFANPTGGVAVAGQANMTTNGSQLLVTTLNGAGTNHSAINWQSFSIPAGNTTYFQQPNAVSTVINRVVTNTPSAIFGTLSSNGKVVLVNQSGIAVGTGALVDTAGFTASSLRMSDADAVAGRLRFGDGTASTSGVSVQGNVLARSGDVVLLGANLDTGKQALMQAPNGNTILAAGQQIEITGRGLEGITLHVQAPTDQAVNLGTLKGEAVGIFAGTLRHSGLIQATKASLEGGKVVLKATDDAFVEGAGQILATGTVGGSVDVLGNRVAVTDQSAIDASGERGGGNVRIGGDYQGKNPAVPNAGFVYFGPQASVKADATDNGKGGRVILWADDTTRAHGVISAQGGAHGGDGGFVETSGKLSLAVGGARVDTRAASGMTGLWLLDPNNIDIVAGPTVNVTGAPSFVSAGAGTLDVADLLTALSSSNVSVTAIDNLTVSTPISDSGPNSLSLKAQSGSLSINQPISLSSGSLGLESTGGSTFLGATLSLSSGALKLKSGGTISQSSGTISALSLEVDSSGAVSLNNANNVSSIAAHVSGGGFSYKGVSGFSVATVGSVTGISTSGGNINLDSSSSIQIDKAITAGSGTVSLTSTGSFIAQNSASTAAISAGTLSVSTVNGASLANDSNAVGTLNVTTSGTEPVSYWNAGGFAVGPITLGGSVTLKSNGGAITQSGAMSTGGASDTVTIIAGGGSVSLGNSSNNLNNLTVTSGGAVNVKNNAALGLNSISAGSFNLKANGTITQNGVISTSGGGVDVSSTAGMISSGEGISASGGPVKLSATSGITLTSIVGVSSDAPGDALVLITTGGLISASTPVTTSGAGGRWLAYVPSFPSNVFPSGMAFKQYNATYGTGVLGTGNGVLVAAAPVLTLSSSTVTGTVSKVYDGGTGIGLSGASLPTITGGTIDGDLYSVAALSASSGSLSDKNVGSGKLTTVFPSAIGITTSGSLPVYGYSVPTLTGNIATVTQRPSATWSGGFNNSWSTAGNWDAIPDGANVAAVIIPAGVGPIVFDASLGTTSLQSLSSGSPILVNGGALQVSNVLSTAGFAQTGGSVSGGTLKVVGPFNQTGGSIDMSGIDVLTPNGGIVFSSLKAPVVSLVASNGTITQLGGVITPSLTTSSVGGTVLNDPGNRIGSFVARNSGSGNVELTNVGVVGVLDINNSGGNVVVSNVGGITTRSVSASGGVSITANSPLDIESGGVSAGGNIVLTATNLTSSGNLTLNAPVSTTGGSVALNAASNLTQNSSVYGSAGVTAVVGGTFTVGPSATSGATPVSYTVGGLPATPPPTTVAPGTSTSPTPPTTPAPVTPPVSPPGPITPVPPQTPNPTTPLPGDPVSNAVVQTNLLTTFLDKFEIALQGQIEDKPGKDKTKNELVLEGETCRP